jgi:plasmid rolling circle replication initiator protein Rep
MADNEKAYHEIAANTTCEFVNKELLQELDKTRNASMLEDADKVVHNLKSYLASFKRNNVHTKILLNVRGWVLKGKTMFFLLRDSKF